MSSVVSEVVLTVAAVAVAVCIAGPWVILALIALAGETP